MKQKQGYCITTYRFRLYRKHPEWFTQTKEIYCRIAEFYLKLILDRNLSAITDYELQRTVEVLTQGEKKKNSAPIYPMPYDRVPLYFRRAALREAAAAARSFCTRQAEFESRVQRPIKLDTSPVYYKGMYRNLDLYGKRIELKLYTGTEWRWSAYRFTTDGREIPEGAELLSPTIKLRDKQVYLHFPVKELVEDIRTVRERAGERYLTVSLQMGDVFAACVAETRKDSNIKENSRIHMIRGGKEFRNRRICMEAKLEQALKDRTEDSAETEHLRERLRNLIREQAHKVSREIVNFAMAEDCKVIAVPDYLGNPKLNRKPYLFFSDYDWIGRRIVEYTAYKSFQKGIVLCRIPAKGISSVCSQCGERIKRYNEGHEPGEGYLGGRLYVCPNGHRGNTAVNTAENVGKRYWERYVMCCGQHMQRSLTEL